MPRQLPRLSEGWARYWFRVSKVERRFRFCRHLRWMGRENFWRSKVAEVATGKRVLLAGWVDGVLAGCVMLDLATPPNQPHRAEVQKLLVDPAMRRRRLARRLTEELEQEAGRERRAADAGHMGGWWGGNAVPDDRLDGSGPDPGVCAERAARSLRDSNLLQTATGGGSSSGPVTGQPVPRSVRRLLPLAWYPGRFSNRRRYVAAGDPSPWSSRGSGIGPMTGLPYERTGRGWGRRD